MLTRDETHHLINVLRAAVGDTVLVFDGAGREVEGIVTAVDSAGEGIVAVRGEQPSCSPSFNIELVQAVPKRGRMEMILQKSTELGAAAIQPLITARTIVRLDRQRMRRKHERWNAILVGAAKQCGVSRLPELRPVKTFDQYIAGRDPESVLIICSLESDAIPIKDFIATREASPGANIEVLVGPEGDFTENEYLSAIAAGAVPVSLGELVLRTDTAAFYILSVLRFAFG